MESFPATTNSIGIEPTDFDETDLASGGVPNSAESYIDSDQPNLTSPEDETPTTSRLSRDLEDLRIHERVRFRRARVKTCLQLRPIEDDVVSADDEQQEFGDFSNKTPFNCQLCANNIDAHAGLVVPGCLHELCKPCLVRAVEQNQDTCPNIVPSTGLLCSAPLSTELIRSNVSQEEFARHKQEQLHLIDDLDVVPNTNEFNCSICYEKIGIGAGIVLRGCIHESCIRCLRQLIIHTQEIDIVCPYVDDDYTCQSVLLQCEIRAILSDQEFDEYLARTLNLTLRRLPNAFYCKTPDCDGFCILEDDINLFECPVCDAANCITCRAIHDEFDCRQYQDWMLNGGGSSLDDFSSVAMVDALIESGEAMRCPKCEIVLMKKEGCDCLTCTMCATEICWVTRGPRWGPAGKNDISGGCRCKVDGKMCHPDCNYCH